MDKKRSLEATIELVLQDITSASCEAIVNAANPQLSNGGGVCGAIFRAAGATDLKDACQKFPLNQLKERCATGQSVSTSSFQLQAQGIKYIIHTPGPDCRKVLDPKEQDRLLTSSYRTALEEGCRLGVGSIAFPFISSAIYKFPKKRAAQVAVDAVSEFLSQNPKGSVKKVVFSLFSDEDVEIFRNTMSAKHSQ